MIDTHENEVGDPVHGHESRGKVVTDERTGNKRQTDSVTRARLKAESEPSSIRSIFQPQRTWRARFVVAFTNKRVERASHSRFWGVRSDDVWNMYFIATK
jgi:hypothetical protein